MPGENDETQQTDNTTPPRSTATRDPRRARARRAVRGEGDRPLDEAAEPGGRYVLNNGTVVDANGRVLEAVDDDEEEE